MSVRISNLTQNPIPLAEPIDEVLGPRSVRIFNYVEYDRLINDPRYDRLLRAAMISIDNLDDLDIPYVSQWNQEPKLRLGGWVYWVDVTGALRMKFGDPTHDLDGFIVGPGGAPIAHGSTHEFTGADPIPRIEVLEDLWNCPAGVAVLDTVYQTGIDSVDQAKADTTATMPAVGIVISKPIATTCIISRSGIVPGFVGLTADTYYYVSDTTAGGITVTPPNTSNHVVQQVGYAKTTTDLVVELGGPLKKA